jgi:hypothetical protein
VAAGQIIVHLKGDFVVGVNCEVLADTLVNTTPDLLSGQATDGVIEYSTNGGGSWIDAGTLIAAGEHYRTTALYTGFDNPLGGRRAFAGNSYGYTASQLDLSSLAGSNVRFRFRVATDTGTGDIGWVVDDVRLYTCTALQTCTYSISPTSTTVQAAGWNGSVAVTASSGTCGWTATSNASWITINSGASGAGSGTASYTVQAYTGKANRTGTLTIAGKTFTVTQQKKRGR